MSYDLPLVQTYTLPNSAIDTATVKLRVIGPAGLRGRLESIGAVITADTTDAASVVQVGTAATADAFGTLSVPVASAGASTNAAVILTDDDNFMAADTVVEIASDGGSTAGDADLTVTIAWF